MLQKKEVIEVLPVQNYELYELSFVKNKSFIMLSKVSSKGILVNRLAISRLVIKLLKLDLLNSLANENGSSTVYSFSAEVFKIRTKS